MIPETTIDVVSDVGKRENASDVRFRVQTVESHGGHAGERGTLSLGTP